jgi:hypothetical protein
VIRRAETASAADEQSIHLQAARPARDPRPGIGPAHRHGARAGHTPEKTADAAALYTKGAPLMSSHQVRRSIGTFPTRMEAEMVQGLLASAGIAAWVAADDAGGAYPFDLSGGAQVLIDESDLEAASQVLAERADQV